MTKFLMTLFFSFLSFSVFAADITAEIDRQEIKNGESVNLIVSSNSLTSSSPDWTPLLENFDITSKRRSIQYSFINGQGHAKSQWILTLRPKHEGVLKIPAISIGDAKTPAMSVAVKKSAAPDLTEPPNKKVFMEVSLSPKEVYVQQESNYAIKVYVREGLDEAYLLPPEVSNASISQVGSDISFVEKKDGLNYHILERHYLIKPQNSGSYTIKAPVLRAVISSNPYDMMNNMYDVMGGPRKLVRVTGQNLTLTVKPKPALFKQKWWLPAKEVTLQEKWSTTKAKVGEPVTREITLRAIGAHGEELPSIALPSIANANIYPDQKKVETQAGEREIVGISQQKMTLVPLQAGNLKIPAVSVEWWNTKTSRVEMAKLPARELIVAAANGKARNSAQPEAQVLGSAMPKQKTDSKSKFWWLLLLLFILPAVLLFRKKRQLLSPVEPRIEDEVSKPQTIGIREIKETAEQNNPRDALNAVLNWAKQQFPTSNINNPADFLTAARTWMTPALAEEISKIDRILYSPEKTSWEGNAFFKAFKEFQENYKIKKRSTSAEEVPSLYLNE